VAVTPRQRTDRQKALDALADQLHALSEEVAELVASDHDVAVDLRACARLARDTADGLDAAASALELRIGTSPAGTAAEAAQNSHIPRSGQLRHDGHEKDR
jgi:hypothetical protein